MNRVAKSDAALLRGAAWCAAGVAICAYFVVLHLLIVRRGRAWLVLCMVLAPWVVAIAALAAKRWRSSAVPVRVAIAAIALVVVVAIVDVGFDASIGIPRTFGRALAANADSVVYVENAAFFAWLSALFGASLASPREALVTRMARRVRRGDMPPPVVRYTRFVTAAWALFFAAMVVASTGLFLAASREAWSLFVNLLIWPLVVVGFVVEYAIRRSVLRHVRHVPLMAGVRAFRERDDAPTLNR